MNNSHKKHKWHHLHITTTFTTSHWLLEKITHVKFERCESVLAVKFEKTSIIPKIISVSEVINIMTSSMTPYDVMDEVCYIHWSRYVQVSKWFELD